MTQSDTTMIQKLFTHKLVRYGILGGISTLIHFTVASAYIYFIYSSVFQCNGVGFLIGYVVSYLMQSKFVFDSYNSYIRTAIVVVLLPLITFLTHKFWTFKTNEGQT